MPWFPDKPKEVSAGASINNGIPGSDSGYCDHGIETSSRKYEKDSCGVTSYGKSRAGLSPSPGTACGEDECNISGDPTSPTIFPPSTDGTVRHIKQKLAVLRGTGSHVSELQGGTDVVRQPYGEMEWEIPPVEGGRYDNRLRPISDRMGCSMSEPTDRRSMVPGRMQDAYKLSGVIGCYTSSPHIPEEQNQDVSPPGVGQYHSSGLYQQPGRDGLQGIGRPSKKSMDVVFREKHSHYSSTPARCTKPDCRCGVSDGGGSVRLEAESSPVQEDYQSLWSNRSGPICISSDRTVPSLFQLAARSICSGNRCLPAGLVSDTGLCQPTLEYDRTGPIPGPSTAGVHCSRGTSVEDTTMVPTSSAHAHCTSLSDQTQTDNVESGPSESIPPASRVAYLRERYRDQELSEEATSLMLKSWRTKTNRSYDSLFRKWHCWCHSRDSNPFSGPVREVVNFLAYLYKEGYQYRSLNSYRSAISSVHERVDGHTVGQHPLVVRLMKGVFNDRPPLPRYTSTWNVQTVLNHIASFGANGSLSLKQLSWKTTMLLALTRPSRSADLSQLHIRGKHYKPDGVVFVPASLAKQSRQGKPVTTFFFPSFPPDPGICPVTTLKAYEERTAPMRGTETRLFLALIKPYRAITSSTIARWLKSLLDSAGIDTSVFNAHSV